MSNAEQKVREVLNSIVHDKFPDATEVKIKPISSDGANFSSVLFQATVGTPKETIELFTKVGSLGDVLNNASKRIFYTEKFVLTTLSNAYEKLQNKYGITEKIRFPKFYNDRCIEGVPIIVMENLACLGYECYDRFKSVNWNYASKSIESLARFHALSFALKKEYPLVYKEASEMLKMPDEDMESPIWDGITDGAMAVVDEQDKQRLAQLLENSVGWSDIMKLSEPRKTSVIIHGDYRASNLMHKEVNGEYHVIPVDYQTARLGCPVADLIYFIFMGTDQQFRQQHYHKLVDHYYEHLALMMTKLSLQPDKVYGREEFDSDMKAKLPIGLCVAAAVLPFVTVDPANAPNFERNEFLPRANELFNERFRGLVQDCKQWEVL